MSAAEMAADLLALDPATYQGDLPESATFSGHRHLWIQQAFTVMRELGLVGHENARTWMDYLSGACWDVTGQGDAHLWAWSLVYERWAQEQADLNAAKAAEKRSAK